MRKNDLLQRLANGERLPFAPALEGLLEANKTKTGNAPAQTQSFVDTVLEILVRYPDAAA